MCGTSSDPHMDGVKIFFITSDLINSALLLDIMQADMDLAIIINATGLQPELFNMPPNI